MDFRIRALRAALRATDAFAPEMTRRWIQGRFMRPPRFEWPKEERAMLRRACPFSFQSSGLTLRGWSWGEGAPVLLAHGWGGRASQFHAFVNPLVQAGFSVLAFDAPGHGRSEGRTATVPRFAQAMEDLAAQRGPFHAVIGHSFGGATTAYALSHGLPASRGVIIAAPESPESFYRGLLETLGFPSSRHDAMIHALEADLQLRFHEVHGPSRATAIAVPGLILHDALDREVPFSHGEAYAQSWHGSRLVRSQGLGHRRILKDPGVIGSVLAFLTEGAPLASGPLPREGPRSLEWHLFHREQRAL